MTKFDQEGIAMSYQIATRIQVCVLCCACCKFPVIYPIPFNSHFPWLLLKGSPWRLLVWLSKGGNRRLSVKEFLLELEKFTCHQS